jgi:hypothetical protein
MRDHAPRRNARDSLSLAFPGFDPEVWNAQLACWDQMAQRADADYQRGATTTIASAVVTEDFIWYLRLHPPYLADSTQRVFQAEDLKDSIAQLGKFSSVNVTPHHRVLGMRTTEGVVVWFWVGHTHAHTSLSKMKLDIGVLLFVVLVLVASMFASVHLNCGEWLERSGAVVSAGGGWLAYLSLGRYHNKARKSVHRGYWLTTSHAQRWMDGIALACLLVGTLLWGYGTKLLALFDVTAAGC